MSCGILMLCAGCSLVTGVTGGGDDRARIEQPARDPAAIERAIKHHKILRGMTTTEVLESWDTPARQDGVKINDVLYNVWVYETPRSRNLLYFHRGVLVDIKH